jgi:hypothetical protein
MAKQQTAVKEKAATVSAPKQSSSSAPFIFDKTNYTIMLAGIITILVGFALMSGGGTSDPNVFPKEELYSFRRITLAPIIVMLGFGIEIFAILKRPKS